MQRDDFTSLVRQARSVRRFREDAAVSMETLERLTDLARQTPSAGNKQPLRYVLITDTAMREAVFACLGWAAALPEWPGPEPGQRPTGYIIICGDARVSERIDCDHGIAAQTILLGAASSGLAGCMIGSVKRARLAERLRLPDQYAILLVLALGEAAETVALEEVAEGGSLTYYRDEHGVHHTPKRRLEDVVLARHG